MARQFTEEERQKGLQTRQNNKILLEQAKRNTTISTGETAVVAQAKTDSFNRYIPTMAPKIESEEVHRKREQLEIARMEAELNALKTPPIDTKLDYFQKMLELQQQHNKEVLELQKSKFETQLELAKLQEGAETDWSGELIQLMMPMLPSILANFKQNTQQAAQTPLVPEVTPQQTGSDAAVETVKGEEMGFVQELKAKLKSGKLTTEQAYEDFKKEAPEYAKFVNKEQFTVFIEKLKQS